MLGRSAKNMKILISIVLLALTTSINFANELEKLSKDFVMAVTNGNTEELKKIYLDSSTLQKTIDDFLLALPLFEEKKLTVSHVPRELIIGNLGVSLIKLKSTDGPTPSYKPLIFVKTESGWKLFPWSRQADLKILIEQRNPDEQIHIQLFNKWANLVEDQLTATEQNQKMQNKSQ